VTREQLERGEWWACVLLAAAGVAAALLEAL
jgi:hypothetical protein